MTRLDNDLISRKALLDEIEHLIDKHPRHILRIITNAPTVEADSGEPVAYLNDDNCIDNPVEAKYVKKMQARGELLQYTIPLYTSPPKREWVDLTDEQIGKLLTTHYGWNEFAKAIESKLKELNHG